MDRHEEWIVRVALDQPTPTLFEYRYATAHKPQAGQLAHVPFGRRMETGLIWGIVSQSALPLARLREVEAIWHVCPPLSAKWRALLQFAADYYQRGLGEIALPALPGALRDTRRWPRLSAHLHNAQQAQPASAAVSGSEIHIAAPALTSGQAQALQQLNTARGFAPFLLHGVTGSGKTEVYLRLLTALFARTPDAQALVLVPEINLTPQIEAILRARIQSASDAAIITLHSGLSEGARARRWLAAHCGHARIVIGTRLAVLASLPRLALIIVDEEHDAAYKQQEGLRYSARDLAVWRARQLDIPVVLGSATPALETWRHAEQGRYARLSLPRRAHFEAALPAVHLIHTGDARQRSAQNALPDISAPLLEALRARLERKEQSLIFLNRRGYAPVLACDACGWLAGCARCSVYAVLHKAERALRCHHCGLQTSVPRACPVCGNIDLAPLGRGTQRIEESLLPAFPGARIARLDADSARRKGCAQMLFDRMHAGDVDILIGTQMIAKGHDFQRVTLVGILNSDAALFSHDFRAGERLFAQLMQAGGRAGRAGCGEVLIQTRYPHHPLYQALRRHDYAGFAAAALAERRQARLPPFIYQALLRAEAHTLEAALDFLSRAAAALDRQPEAVAVTRYDPVPMNIVKIRRLHRAQFLLESASRAALQRTLSAWRPDLRALKVRGIVRWMIEVDPLDI
ncbi:Primosomal protein N' [Candidatus Glomeribacter gigasporarum BEG34]|uniref:Replication restart protein PriA n=1 Tax=Candidatus Glomeribacter gigasporarum BEG34 TaxID=1070319 RepID=G2J9F8_9BURK|nr:primosomal protein N' [Candidatus Glomeribacter gigasporarum]CCD29405.1 Primosomal protein N' [Candidatus Glomeribacter gigasporarum BEG34]